VGPLPAIGVACIGLMYGAVCGYLIVFGSVIGSRDALTYILVPLVGALLGAPFGLIAFPAAFYAMLADVPLRRTLPAIAYGTVVAGWIGSIVASPRPADPTWLFLVKIYAPVAFGLIGAGLWLRATPDDERLSRGATFLLIAVAAAALIGCFVVGLRVHTR
jgi:hypothetical protein